MGTFSPEQKGRKHNQTFLTLQVLTQRSPTLRFQLNQPGRYICIVLFISIIQLNWTLWVIYFYGKTINNFFWGGGCVWLQVSRPSCRRKPQGFGAFCVPAPVQLLLWAPQPEVTEGNGLVTDNTQTKGLQEPPPAAQSGC